MRKSAGKTSVIVGIAAALNKKMAYIKPFGERMLYRKKRLWDYDSALITNLFGLKEDPVDMSIGFDHSKLRYMYDEEGTRKKLLETVAHIGKRQGDSLHRRRAGTCPTGFRYTWTPFPWPSTTGEPTVHRDQRGRRHHSRRPPLSEETCGPRRGQV